MGWIGREPAIGNYQVCDALSASSTATYALAVGGTSVSPESANHVICSLNGVIQKPVGSFTISGSNIVFDSALTSSDSIDFILLLGSTLDVGIPSDASITNAKLASDVISGETDIGGAIADADLFLIDDGAGGTLRKSAMSRIKTYVGGGKIAQVVSSSTVSAVTITATSFTDSGITADITPSASSSKILILISAGVLMHGNARASSIGGVNILRDSTQIYGGGTNNAMGMYTENQTGLKMWAGHSHTFLDSPSSTSAITYKMQGRIESSGESMQFQTGGMNSVITLMEVLA